MQKLLFNMLSWKELNIPDSLRLAMAAEVAECVSLAVCRAAAMRNIQSLLTDREREVIHLVGVGLSNAEISARLVISERTVRQHLENMQLKLGVCGRGKLVAVAFALAPMDTVSA